MIRTVGLTALLAAMSAPLAAQEAPEFVVHINEPFLTFETEGDLVRIITPGDVEGTVVPMERLEAAGVVHLVGEYGGERFVVTVVETPCEDDMAGLPYSHTAAMSWGETLKDGCARLASEPEPQEGG